ncbi:MAG: AIR carboxylase family protein [Actinobacteria bacterium]|nr:AIR carboxylase family protein [Actinomycetota bacterium]
MSDIADPNPPEIGTAELPPPDPEVEAELEQIEENFAASGPLVGIIAGTNEDLARMLPAEEYLAEQGIASEVRVMDAPDAVGEYCEGARAKGLKAIVVGAAMSTALPGVAAAHTDLPVIGVPLVGEGLDSGDALLATVQVPAATPVAGVAIDGAESAGVLAARIITA